jgi:crotonobetainyl-CoA:carnitine CoA-transferase CaiB-like acyl-CoA transferase
VLLDGLTILSFCHFLQGPAAMQYLADMGADVIKIEPPSGAFERQQHNQTFKDVMVNDETVRLLNHPLRYDGSVPGYRSFPLTQGADTRPVLEEIGFTSAEVNELFRNGVAFAGE